MVILAVAPPVAELVDAGGDLVRGGDDGAGVAVGTDVLPGIEAGGRGDPEAAARPAVAPRPLRLGGVLDQGEPAGLGDLSDRLQVRHLAEEVDGEDGPGPRSDGVCDAAR